MTDDPYLDEDELRFGKLIARMEREAEMEELPEPPPAVHS